MLRHGTTTVCQKLCGFIFAYSRWEEEIPALIFVRLDDWTPHHVVVRLRGQQEYQEVQIDPNNLNTVTLQTCKDIADRAVKPYNPAGHQPQPTLQYHLLRLTNALNIEPGFHRSTYYNSVSE